MPAITEIKAREVLDSRGKPTIEVEIHVEGGHFGRTIAPSGASTGKHEAVELRDRHQPRFAGQGVQSAVKAVAEQIAPALQGIDCADQQTIDRTLCDLDGTANKSRLGGNSVLAVSIAAATAEANSLGIPLWSYIARISGSPVPPSLPMPMVNMISGGLHAGGYLDIQDFLAIPIGAGCYAEALEWISRVYQTLGALLRDAGYEGYLVGDEGGFGPMLPDHESALQLLCEAFSGSNLEPGRDIAIGLDVASSHFFRAGKYVLSRPTPKTLEPNEFIDLLADWTERFPICSLEDPLEEDDWAHWSDLTSRLGARCQVIGDDLFVTQKHRLLRGIDQGAANAILVKMNQVGTLSETLDVVRTAAEFGYAAVVSARSGETEDVTMCHLAVGTGAGQIKIGSICRSERLAKYNELIRIAETEGMSYAKPKRDS